MASASLVRRPQFRVVPTATKPPVPCTSPNPLTAPAEAAAPALVLIAAVARNGIIGAGNALPWRLPEDMRRFRTLTMGHAVIMGRRTWDSLPRALPGRQNIVVSTRAEFAPHDADVVLTWSAAIARVRMPLPVYCIGGGAIYALALPEADTMLLTEIDAEIPGDTHFPAFSTAEWKVTERSARMESDGLAYAFVTWRRVGPPH